MFIASLKLLLLRPIGFEALAFPRWQPVAAHAAALLAWLMPQMASQVRADWVTHRWNSLGSALAAALVWVLAYAVAWWVGFGLIRGLLRAGRRWDGDGDLFKLLATATWPVLALLVAAAAVTGPWGNRGDAAMVGWLLCGAFVAARAMTGAIPALGLSGALVATAIGGVLGLISGTVVMLAVLGASIAIGGL